MHRMQRAKSENKYYSTMRDKEAVENERKNLARNFEKQAKVLERLTESEKNLSSRLVSSELVHSIYELLMQLLSLG